MYHCRQVDEVTSSGSSPLSYITRFPASNSAAKDAFAPLICRDTMFNKRQGTNQLVNTKLLCITASTPHSNASLEELRWKAYKPTAAPATLHNNIFTKSLVLSHPFLLLLTTWKKIAQTQAREPAYYHNHTYPVMNPYACTNPKVSNPPPGWSPGNAPMSGIYATTASGASNKNAEPVHSEYQSSGYALPDLKIINNKPVVRAFNYPSYFSAAEPSMAPQSCMKCENMEQSLEKMIPAMVDKFLEQKMADGHGQLIKNQSVQNTDRQQTNCLEDEADKVDLRLKKEQTELNISQWKTHLIKEQVLQAKLNTRLLQLKVEREEAKASKKKTKKKKSEPCLKSSGPLLKNLSQPATQTTNCFNKPTMLVDKCSGSTTDQSLLDLALTMQRKCLVQNSGTGWPITEEKFQEDAPDADPISEPSEATEEVEQKEEDDNDSDGHSSWSEVNEEGVDEHSSPLL
uniref:Uncharacterized protein n=1 Tax=Ditylenchus dipsaci TaxID=166011 RepID=A0A915DU36_9BILA